jgi:hypothetical protein
MSLTRVWTPSGNYSGGGKKRILVIHTMEGFTGSNGAYDCAKYFQTDCGASSQVCIDNNRGKIWECVSRDKGSWTQCGFNSESVSCEQSGYASWSRDYWLSNRENQLRNIADWLAEESGKFGIPLVDISSSSAQGSGSGVCYHSELGSAGCGHSDPGSGFPLDKVLEWAKGGSSGTTEQEGTFMPGVTFDGLGRPWESWIGKNGEVRVSPPGYADYAVDPNQSGAKGGSSIAWSPSDDTLAIVYINGNNEPCMYRSPVSEKNWGWTKLGANAKA